MAGLFDEFRLKDVVLRNRIAVSPMCQYSSDNGFPNDWHFVHLGSRAVGGAGLVVVEATAVSPEGRISPADRGIWLDEHVQPFARISHFLKQYGAVPGIQLAHAGRKASANKPWEGDDHIETSHGGWDTIAPSPVAFGANLPKVPRAMTAEDIARIQDAFVAAAKRSLAAGFEWLELHFAHGYLAHQFYSPLANHRTDAYTTMHTSSPKLLLIFVLLATSRIGLSAEQPHNLANLERSFWLHASLATTAQKGYWGPEFPASPNPTEADIRNAAKLLTGSYAANRLFLVYHHEIPIFDAERVFRWWRQHCPEKVTLVPTLVLRMYDPQQTPVFTSVEIRRLVEFFKQSINAEQLAVYDVYPKRDQGEALTILAEQYRKGLIRVGIQPEEKIEPPFAAAVQDTWSGFCHGKTNADWLDRGFGTETLQKWVEDRNRQRHPVTWDLIVVAWDYSATERGGYPGYDDAAKNMPLPAGRNRLAAKEILRTGHVGCVSGFSGDLLILQANSLHTAHDGARDSFYETLKRGERTIDKNEQKRVAGNLYNRQIVVKYEIENFKDKAVTLDISENIRALRNEVAGDTGRDVQWELGEGTTLPGQPDKEKSTFEQVVFHVDLPARGADQKAVKAVHKLDVLIRNEW